MKSLPKKTSAGKKSGNGKRRSIFQVGCTLGLWLLAPIVSYSACHTSKFWFPICMHPLSVCLRVLKITDPEILHDLHFGGTKVLGNILVWIRFSTKRPYSSAHMTPWILSFFLKIFNICRCTTYTKTQDHFWLSRTSRQQMSNDSSSLSTKTPRLSRLV